MYGENHWVGDFKVHQHLQRSVLRIGAGLVLLGISNGFSLPVLNQLASNENFRWWSVGLGVLSLGVGVAFAFVGPKECESQVHEYSGTWRIQAEFSRWRDTPFDGSNTAIFSAMALLVIQKDGQKGQGLEVGVLEIQYEKFKARYKITNEILSALVTERNLTLTINVFIRDCIEEVPPPPDDPHAEDPYARFRGKLSSIAFTLSLQPQPDHPAWLAGPHTYPDRSDKPYQIAWVTYEHMGLIQPLQLLQNVASITTRLHIT